MITKAAPQPEDLYRQEHALGEAEDVAEVLAVGVDATLPNGTEYNVPSNLFVGFTDIGVHLLPFRRCCSSG
jgi:hypothetical protein